MLKITASLADGIPVDLRGTLTGLDMLRHDLARFRALLGTGNDGGAF